MEAKNLKKSGVKAGVPDLHLPAAKRGYNGLWLEMKRIGGRTSAKQKDWINGLQELGHAAFVCYGADEAIEKLKWYLNEI